MASHGRIHAAQRAYRSVAVSTGHTHRSRFGRCALKNTSTQEDMLCREMDGDKLKCLPNYRGCGCLLIYLRTCVVMGGDKLGDKL